MPDPFVPKSGLIGFVNRVRAYFTARGYTADISVGWKKRTLFVNEGPGGANRVVFVPCEPSGGSAGEITGAKQVGPRDVTDSDGNLVASVRALRTWERMLFVSIWGVDASDVDDEEKQIEATDTLFEQVVQGVEHAAGPNAVWVDPRFNMRVIERTFGHEMTLGLIYKHPLFDAPLTPSFPTAEIRKHPL